MKKLTYSLVVAAKLDSNCHLPGDSKWPNLIPDRWRSLNHLKGSLNHPKKGTKNCQVLMGGLFLQQVFPKRRISSLSDPIAHRTSVDEQGQGMIQSPPKRMVFRFHGSPFLFSVSDRIPRGLQIRCWTCHQVLTLIGVMAKCHCMSRFAVPVVNNNWRPPANAEQGTLMMFYCKRIPPDVCCFRYVLGVQSYLLTLVSVPKTDTLIASNAVNVVERCWASTKLVHNL